MPTSPKSTNFMNVKRRVIMKTAAGKYVVKTDKGLKYAPKAKYYRNPAGSTVNVKYAHANVVVPSPIRPKLIRKAPKRPVGRPRKMVAWNLPNPMGAGMRKMRINKGVKRVTSSIKKLFKM